MLQLLQLGVMVLQECVCRVQMLDAVCSQNLLPIALVDFAKDGNFAGMVDDGYCGGWILPIAIVFIGTALFICWTVLVLVLEDPGIKNLNLAFKACKKGTVSRSIGNSNNIICHLLGFPAVRLRHSTIW